MPPKKKEIEIKELSQDEINEFLKNSIQIPKEQWPTLPINSYISYYKEDGKFIKGGYIKLIFSKKDPKSDDINDYLIYGTKLDNEKKIIKLEENHYKTIKLIKNLHNIKNLDNVNK